MREEFVTVEELMAQLREKGLEDCRDVKAAYREADGHISIIPRDGKRPCRGRRRVRSSGPNRAPSPPEEP